jgi:prepilin-type N-terminal cleavage/methylation domain-containing protein
MKRSGFTMVELIFVIIIIGILSAAAIPKFGDIKDRAKINAEYNALSGLDSAIIAKMEFHQEDNSDGNLLIDWHDVSSYATSLDNAYQLVNTNKQVLKSVIKKGDDFRIVSYADTGTAFSDPDSGVDDVILIKGTASNKTSGVKKITDVIGKPDSNDVWVFNGSAETVYMSHYVNGTGKLTAIESGEIVLIDNDNTIEALNGSATGEDKKLGLYESDKSTAITLSDLSVGGLL